MKQHHDREECKTVSARDDNKSITKIHKYMIRARVRKCAKFFYDDFTEVTEGVTLTCKIVFSLPSSKQIQSTLTINVVNLT